MMKTLRLILALLLLSTYLMAQSKGDRKIVIITFDGLRWTEVFGGADAGMLSKALIKAKDSVTKTARFWNSNSALNRAQLMPFLWKTIGTKGQIYGNRNLDSKVNVTNKFWFSYPGYNEIFTGYADPRVNSNDFGPNPNETVQAYINKQSGYKESVAAFASWAAFNRILNKEQCGFLVNAGYEAFTHKSANERQKVLSESQFLLPKTFGNNERPDAITYYLAKEYLKENHPKVLQISFIETDAYAHRNLYADYLLSANNNDKMIEDLWNYLQRDPFYKNQTTLFIANDHGRGSNAADNWTHHNSKEPGSDQIWFAVMGPDVAPLGEMKNNQVYQNQFAKTIGALLGIDFKSEHQIGDVIGSVLRK